MFNIDLAVFEELLPSPEPSSLFVIDEKFEEKLFEPLIQTSERKIMDAQILASISQIQSEVFNLKKILGLQEYRIQSALVHICTCASFIFGLTLFALCMYSCKKKKKSTPQIINVEPLKTEMTLKV